MVTIVGQVRSAGIISFSVFDQVKKKTKQQNTNVATTKEEKTKLRRTYQQINTQMRNII